MGRRRLLALPTAACGCGLAVTGEKRLGQGLRAGGREWS